jgi:hypothetical protein
MNDVNGDVCWPEGGGGVSILPLADADCVQAARLLLTGVRHLMLGNCQSYDVQHYRTALFWTAFVSPEKPSIFRALF